MLPTSSLYLNFDGNGKSAAHAKRLGGDFQNRGSLLAFVFGLLHQADHLFDEFQRKSVHPRNALRSFIALHISLKNWIEDFVRRQRVRVLLVGPQLRRRRLFKNRSWNRFALPVE